MDHFATGCTNPKSKLKQVTHLKEDRPGKSFRLCKEINYALTENVKSEAASKWEGTWSCLQLSYW